MDDHDRLIMEIYEAAHDPDYFPYVAERISDAVGGASVHVLLSDLSTETEYLSLLARGDDAFSGEYVRDFIDCDFRVPRVLSQAPGVLVDEAAYVAPEERARSDIHQLLLPKYDIHNIVGANLTVDGTVGWFGISTRRADSPFDAVQMRLLSGIVPHLHHAFWLLKANAEHKRLHTVMGSALDVVGAPIFIFRGGLVEFANVAAMDLLADGFFRIVSGRLICANGSENRRITGFLRRIIPSQPVPLLVRDLESGTTYSLRSSYAGRHSVGVRPQGRILTISRISQAERPDERSVAEFCRQYSLSRRETAVIEAVLGEVPLRAFANAESIALNTVQKQLKAALQKLDLKSQKALFRTFERFRILGAI